jgi:F-type H+-transporting ATPase subunit epsilon
MGMAKTFQLDIVTPERVTYSEAVESVALPAVEGELGVLPGHMNLVAELKPGEMRFTSSGQTQHLAVSGGFAQITGTKVVVLAETAELAHEIDVARAQQQAQAKAAVVKGAITPDDLVRAQASLMKELARLKVAERLRRRPS